MTIDDEKPDGIWTPRMVDMGMLNLASGQL